MVEVGVVGHACSRVVAERGAPIDFGLLSGDDVAALNEAEACGKAGKREVIHHVAERFVAVDYGVVRLTSGREANDCQVEVLFVEAGTGRALIDEVGVVGRVLNRTQNERVDQPGGALGAGHQASGFAVLPVVEVDEAGEVEGAEVCRAANLGPAAKDDAGDDGVGKHAVIDIEFCAFDIGGFGSEQSVGAVSHDAAVHVELRSAHICVLLAVFGQAVGDVEHGEHLIRAVSDEEGAVGFELSEVDAAVLIFNRRRADNVKIVEVHRGLQILHREEASAGGGHRARIDFEHVAVDCELIGMSDIVFVVSGNKVDALAFGDRQLGLNANFAGAHSGGVELIPSVDVGVAIEDVDVDLVDNGSAGAVGDGGAILVEQGIGHSGVARFECGQSGAADRREGGVCDREIFGVGNRLGKVDGVVLGVSGDVADPVVIQSELGVVENDGDRFVVAAGHQDDGSHQYREHRDHGQNSRHKLFGFCHKVLLYDVVRAM